jgi:hypothetical protein
MFELWGKLRLLLNRVIEESLQEQGWRFDAGPVFLSVFFRVADSRMREGGKSPCLIQYLY